MYTEFYLKNLDDCLFNPSIANAISDKGLSVLSRTKYSFRVISNQKYTASVTYNIEFDTEYNLASITPNVDNQTKVNLLFYLSNYYMNALLQNLYSQNFNDVDEEYIKSFIKELISCNLDNEKFFLCLNYISTSSKRSEGDLLKIYFENLKKYYFYDQLLNICNKALENSEDNGIRATVIDEFFNLISKNTENFSSLQINKINNLVEKMSDEEFLTILKDEERSSLLFNSNFSFSFKIDSLIRNKDLITIDELIKILPESYIDKIVSDNLFTHFTLAIYFNRKTREETENYLNRHFTFNADSAQITFKNNDIIDLICQNYLYTPLLKFLGTYLYKSNDTINTKYHNILNLLNYVTNKYEESRPIICRFITKNFPDTFRSIFNCLIDNDGEEDRSTIYYTLKSKLLSYCPSTLLIKVLVKINSYYSDYFIMLYNDCGDDENLKSILFEAILNSEFPIENLFSNQSSISVESITTTPLVILLEKCGKLGDFGIKKVDL